MLMHTAAPIPPKPILNLSIIIPCHNYGKYLKDAIDSIITQTALPLEIIVVDDASTDNTKTIAETYSGHGVKYFRINAKNVHQARKAGLDKSKASIVCFLDADDRLPSKWLERGHTHFSDPSIGVVYCDIQKFGNSTDFVTYPPTTSKEQLARENCVVSCALVRRQALILTNAFDFKISQETSLDDWFLWRRIAQYGWKFIKQTEPLLYRIHDTNMLATKSSSFREKYYDAAVLNHETITLFIPLSGRLQIWKHHLSKYLERQKWPHNQCNLIITNSAQDENFAKTVKDWIRHCDYKDVRYIELTVDNDPKLADRNRLNPTISKRVDLACCKLYNKLARSTETDYTWIIEDDIIPPDNAAEMLLKAFAANIASCTGSYKSRFNNGYVIRKNSEYLKRPITGGLQPIDDSGFGCLMVRSEFLRQHVFYIPEGQSWYDPAFFMTIPPELEKLVNWDCECRHINSNDTQKETNDL